MNIEKISRAILLFTCLIVLVLGGAVITSPGTLHAQESCSFTRDLHQGVRGDDVRCLQSYLQDEGFFPDVQATTNFFGPVTRVAVQEWQEENAVTPPQGYFGPVSRSTYETLTANFTHSRLPTVYLHSRYENLVDKAASLVERFLSTQQQESINFSVSSTETDSDDISTSVLQRRSSSRGELVPGGAGSASSQPTSTPDTTDPAEPSNLATSDVDHNTATLTWTDGTDNEPAGLVAALARNGTEVDTVLSGTETYDFTGLSAETSYILGVRMRDAAGNESQLATTSTTTTAAPATTALSQPLQLGPGVYNQWIEPLTSVLNDTVQIGAIDENGERFVYHYNNSTGTTSSVSLGTGGEVDDHNAPAVYIEPDGWGITIYSDHNGPGDVEMRTTSDGGTTWSATSTIISGSHNPTYAQVHRIPSTDRLVFFNRITSDVPSGAGGAWIAMYSDDDGATWSAMQELFQAPTYPYPLTVMQGDGDTIGMATAVHPDTGSDHTVRAWEINGVSGDVTAWGGSTVLGNIYTGSDLPVDPTDGLTVYDANEAGDETTRLLDLSPRGEVLFLTWDTTDMNDTAQYNFAKVASNGSVSTSLDMIAAGHTVDDVSGARGYFGNAVIEEAGTVALAREDAGAWYVEKWVTENEGSTWTDGVIYSTSTSKVFRPQWMGPANVAFVEGSYTHFETYDTDVWAAPALNDLYRINRLSDTTVNEGNTTDVELEHFAAHPGGSAITYAATSSDSSVATTSISGTTLTLGGVASGTAMVTVTATDAGGDTVQDDFTVTTAASGLSAWAGYDSAAISAPSSDLTDFTLLVDLSRLSSSWWSNVAADGADIRFYKGDGTTELPYDLMAWDHGASSGWARVKWDGALSSAGGDTLRAYAGNGPASAYAAGDTYGQYNAYDTNTAAYWTLDEDPSGVAPQMLDRTINTKHGTIASTTPTSVAGQVNNALDFLADNDQVVSVGDITDNATAVTISAWVEPDRTDKDLGIYYRGYHTSGDPLAFWLDTESGTTSLAVLLKDNADDSSGALKTETEIAADQRAHVSFTFEGGNQVRVFVDGVEDPASPFDVTSIEEIAELRNDGGSVSEYIGDQDPGPETFSEKGMDGMIDEVRTDLSARSPAWIAHEYSQTNDQAAFWGAWGWTAQ